MTRLPRWTSACRLGLALLPTLALAEPPSAAAAEPGRDAGLEFVRVTVPAERLREVPLDGGRLIPMPLKDFDRAVAGLLPEAAARRPRPLADAARYVLAIDDRGRLSGRLEFDLGAAAAAVGASVPVGDLSVQRAMLRSDDGVGEAVVFGMPGGRVAVKTPSPGTYACDLACPPSAAGEFRLPLVAALVTRLDLRLPETLKPVVANRGAGAVVVSRPEGEGAWRIDLAGADAIDLAIVPREDGQPRVRCWNRIVVRGRQVDVAVRIVPEAAWRTGPIRLRGDLRLEVIGGRSAAAAAEAVPVAGEADRIDVEVPPTLAGTLVPIDVWGVADAALDAAFMVPTIRPPPERWAGGGATLVVDPAFAVANLDAEECLVVAPSAADRWHVPAVGPTVSGAAATIHLEQQSAAARATATIEPRVPRLDTCRVTTLELSPGAVLGRAACAVGVPAGEAFVITGRVAPEWFIDSVEPVEWPTTAAGDGQGKREGEGEGEDAEQRLPVVERDRTLDWRVLRTESANELRIGLAEAATPARPLGLRITGHRRGVPIGGEVPTGDLDMVRLDGETAESSLVDYRVGPDAVIELDGRPMGVEPADERLAVLAEPGAPRGRIRGGTGGGTGVARLVRRRPPLEADVLVQLVARDSRITESLTVSCRPDAGAVDSVVVRVSEPLGDAVDWTLVDPPAGTLYARRLEPGGTSADDSLPGQESWLVEFRPVVAGPVTFRATRTRPFTGAVAAPLAWVDGATEARGTVVVRGAGGTRPTVLNRGLAERPPQIPDDRSAAVVTELSYGAAADLPRFPESGAVVVSPPEVAEARAWVWREATTAWCHDSGAIECETRFDIENRGRTEVALTVPGGLRLDEVSIDGEPAPFDVPSEAGGTTSVPLPAGRGRIELHVRGVAVRETALGAWRIDPVACGIDVPVLDRDRVVKLPADLDLISPGREGAAGDGWVERLFDAGLARPAAAAVEPVSTEAGFRTVAVAPATSGRGLFVVRRRLVSTAAIGVAGIAAAALAWAVRVRPRAAVTAVIGLALASLWTPPAFAVIARAAWWGGLAGLWFRAARRGAIVIVIAAALPATAAADPGGPLRVYVTPAADGGTALVPEPLFRRLTATLAEAESVRVRSCRLVVAPQGPWRLELEVDGERGGVLTLDQSGMAVRWLRGEQTPGVAVDVVADGTAARIVTVAAGLHRIVIELAARPVVEGGLEAVTLRLPPAAEALVDTVTAVAPADTPQVDRWQCDRGNAGGGWRPVTSAAGAFDVARADRVRLVRSADPRRPLAAEPAEARSQNEIWWGEGACVIKAAFEITAGRQLLRSVVVRADRPLEPGGDAGPPLVSLGAGRYLVELPEPAVGQARIDLVFAMPLDDPTGAFDVPGVWLDAVGADERTVRCAAAAGLELAPELPAGYALMRPGEGEAADVAAAWRSESVATPAGGGQVRGGLAGTRSRARVLVRRMTPPQKIAQRLDITWAGDGVEFGLEGQIDARGGVFAGVTIELPADATVERVAVVGDGHDAGEAVNVHVSRPTATQLRVAVQQPRPGSYRLTVAAHVSGRPASRGRMPLVRCVDDDGPPLVVRWRSRPGIAVAVTRDGELPVDDDVLEIRAGDPGPEYELTEADSATETPERDQPVPVAAPADVPLGNAVEATIVHLSLADRGRIWGMARFEVVASAPVVRLRLPPGLRLFDVLIDGREAEATPVEASAWDVRLHDVRWPRSLLAVFAGDVGAAVDAGGAVQLELPRLEGLPCRGALWTLDIPAGMRLRVAEPARVVDAGIWRAAQADVRRTMAGLFAAAVEGTLDADRERLTAFAAARDDGAKPALEDEWERAIQAAPDSGRSRVWVVDGEADGLTIRAVRPQAAGVQGRTAATVALVTALVAGWLIAAWRPAVWRLALTRSWPWLLIAGGLAWVAMLRPMLPGLALLVAGVAALATRRPAPMESHVSAAAAVES